MIRKIATTLSLSLAVMSSFAAGSPYSSLPIITVTTSPLLHIPSARDGSDLIVTYPSASEQLTLLLQKQKFARDVNGKHTGYPNQPIIELSGKIEGDVAYNSNSDTSFNLGSAELDINALASSWASAFLSLSYDNMVGDNQPNTLANSSKFYLRRAFVALGDLNTSPFYFSAGQMYQSFGVYSLAIITDVMTANLFKTDDIGAEAGYYKNGFHASIYGFSSDKSNIAGHKGIDKYGFGAGYKGTLLGNTQQVNIGYISTITDAINLHGVTDAFKSARKLPYSVPGLDIQGNFTLSKFNLIAEYITALKKYNSSFFPSSDSYGKTDVAPSALDIELGYLFNIKNLPSNIYLDYQHSSHAERFTSAGLEKDSYVAVFNTSLLKNTVEGIEYRHNNLYVNPLNDNKKDENIVTAQVGVYF